MWGLSQKEKNNALVSAFWHENVMMIETALKKGADANAKIMDGKYPVIWVARYYPETRALEMLDVLMTHNVNVNIADGATTALSTAIEHGNMRMYKSLIEYGADLNKAGGNEKSATHLAMKYRNWQAAADLMERGLILSLPELIDGGAPLSLITKALEFSDVNATDGRHSALTLAIRHDREDVVDVLLAEPKLNMNLSFHHGQEALYLAISKDKSDIALKLIAHGADVFGVHEKDTGRKTATPFQHAIAKGRTLVVNAILKQAKEKDLVQSLDLNAAIFQAAANGSGQIVSLLAQAGAALEEMDDNGQTLATLAAQNGHMTVLKILARHGADLLKTDKDGVAPYAHARNKNQPEALAYLMPLQPGYVPPPPPIDRERFVKVSNTTLDVKEKGGLTMSFNFFTQQLIYRDPERGGVMIAQNFNDVQRQESITEAYEILKRLNGTPPEPTRTANKPMPLKIK